jgi:hypothetical protein
LSKKGQWILLLGKGKKEKEREMAKRARLWIFLNFQTPMPVTQYGAWDRSCRRSYACRTFLLSSDHNAAKVKILSSKKQRRKEELNKDQLMVGDVPCRPTFV